MGRWPEKGGLGRSKELHHKAPRRCAGLSAGATSFAGGGSDATYGREAIVIRQQ